MLFLIAALATYRLARMLAVEDGPADAFALFRSWVWQQSKGRRDWWVWRGLNCPLCLSFWLGWLLALALPWEGWTWYILTALALSGAASLLYKLEGR